MNTARALRGNVSLDRLMAFRARFGYAPRIKAGVSVPDYLRLLQVALETGEVPVELQPATTLTGTTAGPQRAAA